MSATSQPQGPYKLVTVNTAPERARRLIGRVVENVKDQYTIIHADNVEEIDKVQATVEKNQPDMLFCASMWTPEEAERIQKIAKETRPGIRTMALPQGLQVQHGPDAVVDYIIKMLPGLISS